MMRAPLDYDRPRGLRIDIAVIRHPAEDPAQRVGSVFWNAGGPGGAPTEALPATYSLFAAGLRARFDIVAIDPRGIGRSTPLHCFNGVREAASVLAGVPAGFPLGRTQVRASVRSYQSLADACRRDGGPIQFHMGTANVARDMERLRGLLGESTMNYYGPSYGSYLGATYANLFPDRVGRMVLDGNAPPVEWNDTRAGKRRNTFLRIRSPQGALRGLRMMLRECGAVGISRCAFSAGDPAATEAKYGRLLKRLRTKPATVAKVPFSYPLTASTVGSLLASQNPNGITPGWKTLAALLQSLWKRTRDKSPRSGVPHEVRQLVRALSQVELPKKGYSVTAPEGTSGVLCSDSPNPRNPFSYQAQGRLGEGRQAFGLGLVWSWLAAPCAAWTARDADAYTGPWDRPTPPILVIGTLGDPNTAYSGSKQMASQLANARLLTEAGGGHTALLNKSSCIDRHVDDYFLSGSLPSEGTVCQQDQAPF